MWEFRMPGSLRGGLVTGRPAVTAAWTINGISKSKKEKDHMTVEEAIQRLIGEFPFKGYTTPEETVKGAYSNIPDTVLRYLKPGSSILDFGSGPCDKTAVLQFLGFRFSFCILFECVN